ncbi:hypothetical protein RIF29_31073 [Crotalaria pallida]|uniref:Uncharacterized protein n=1 Tax=Crotalaria pallida TaxID=3830 RepID=A0AAN9EIZ3_CROPI
MEASKKIGIVIKKKPNDHWAFLEDIEAPMWADLALEVEAKPVSEDMSDDWFHQWSARQLKSMFSHQGEGILTSEVGAQGQASPDLPSSVSRSRGKHYIEKNWGGMNLNNLLDKQQGLSKRCFQAGSSFGQEVKPKSKLNVSRPKGLLSAKSGLAFEGNARGNAKSMANCRKPVSSSSSVDNKTGESSARSTITSENTHQQQRYMEVSSQPYDQKSRSFLSVRSVVSLRKSCVTKKASGVQQRQKYIEESNRQHDQKSGSLSVRSVSLGKSCVTEKASRLDIGGDSMKSRGRKSSSGKSSIGSSSNPGYEVESISKHQREKNTDGKDVASSIDLSDKNQCKSANISLRSSILVEGAKSGVEIAGDSMKSRGRKSSSGKSSVGSISNPGYEVKFVSKQQREKIRDAKDVITMSLADKKKWKPANISQASSYRKESNVSFAKPAYHRTAKSLVPCQSTRSLSLLPVRVNKENFCSTSAKEKLQTSKVNSLSGKAKENAAKNITVNQKCTERVVPDGGMIKNHRTTKCNHLKGDTAGSLVLKIPVL